MKEIIIALIGIVGVVIGVITQEVISIFRDKRAEKANFLMGNYNLRKQSYVDIYAALIEYENYFKLFTHPGHDFCRSENYKDFSPLETITNFQDVFYKNEIWLDKSTSKRLDDLISNSQLSNHLAFQLCMEKSIVTEETIVNECIKILDEVNAIKNLIKSVCGMGSLDEYCNKLSS